MNTIEKITKNFQGSTVDSTIITTIYGKDEMSSNQIWTLILDYIKVLIWPLLIFIVLCIFYKQLKLLIERIANESEEISSSFLGLSAKLRNNISSLKTSELDSKNLKEHIDKSIKESQLDEFRLYCSSFFTKSLNIRQQSVFQIENLSQSIDLEDLLLFTTSSLPRERVGAYIGLRIHVNLLPNLRTNERIIEAIKNGLDDGYSRVRYRVVQLISTSEDFANIFKSKLESLYKEETNNAVKYEINRILVSRNAR